MCSCVKVVHECVRSLSHFFQLAYLSNKLKRLWTQGNVNPKTASHMNNTIFPIVHGRLRGHKTHTFNFIAFISFFKTHFHLVKKLNSYVQHALRWPVCTFSCCFVPIFYHTYKTIEVGGMYFYDMSFQNYK